MKIQELEELIEGKGEVKGKQYFQVLKTDNHYIYHIVENETANIIGYEVFERRSVPICLDFENRVYSETEFKEVYPKSKDFGIWAWGCKTLEKAKQRI